MCNTGLLIFLSNLEIFCHSLNKILTKEWFLDCCHWLLDFLRLNFFDFMRLFLNNWLWLFFLLKINDLINFNDNFGRFYFFLYKVKIYLHPKVILVSISFEFKNKCIILAFDWLKFGVHGKNDDINLLDFSISVDPSEMCLLFLVLKVIKWKYSLYDNFAFSFIRFDFFLLLVYDKPSCMDLIFGEIHFQINFNFYNMKNLNNVGEFYNQSGFN